MDDFGCGGAIGILVLLLTAAAVMAGVMILPPMWDEAAADRADAEADREYARAAAVRAEADVTEARMVRDREANLHRETMWYAWTAFVELNDEEARANVWPYVIVGLLTLSAGWLLGKRRA